MLRIGDFSHLGQVSVRTLRHYDDLNLLKPAWIDRFTDYRYYTLEQLPRLNRILAFKDLGFSLDQIKGLLDEDVSIEQMRGMLLLKQADLEQRMQEERERLRRVEARLKQIDIEGTISPYEVVRKAAEAQLILSACTLVPTIADMKDYRCALSHDIYTWLEQTQIIPVAHEMVLYNMGEYREDNIGLEMAVSIDKGPQRTHSLPRGSRLQIRELPAIEEMACIVHRGSIYDVPQGMVALYSWVIANGYQPAGTYREIHLFGREDDPHTDYQHLTLEIQLPIAKVNKSNEHI
ncbi:MerR family transcriptional regulator [Ktedonospora formicarum]|uniref:MerR family transcriptional regulator n=1 Tax=Ktedonospora formicarum TaxID=2778364 RepID=A0A8J3ICG3_9CHLR|nr:MerR family transcriptional regulator [Ktedonospora formicarum]GHO51481.1 MerR family transcriptional regulator [Ktedonospora formicarum]